MLSSAVSYPDKGGEDGHSMDAVAPDVGERSARAEESGVAEEDTPPVQISARHSVVGAAVLRPASASMRSAADFRNESSMLNASASLQVVVLGGAGRLGRRIGAELARLGHSVTLCDTNEVVFAVARLLIACIHGQYQSGQWAALNITDKSSA